MARFTAVRDEDIQAPIVDYSRGYSYWERGPLGHVSYEQLKSGSIEVEGKQIPTTPLSSYRRAQEIAGLLKQQVQAGEFLLSEPAELLPSADSGLKFKPFTERQTKAKAKALKEAV